MLKKLTPVFIVDRIEPSLEFWVDRLGFRKTAEVPEGDHLGFVALEKDNVEVMYQSRTNAEHDLPGLIREDQLLRHSTIVYIEVGTLDEILPKLEGADVVVPLRHTFYGTTEIFVREPAGKIVAFSVHD
jgi:uncharacterized glyoxalase superfamily protein PhnB